MVEKLYADRDLVYWMWDSRSWRNRWCFVISSLSTLRCMVRGAALARSRLKAAKPSRSLDISVQLLGDEMMESRQYWHTWVSGTIVPVSLS